MPTSSGHTTNLSSLSGEMKAGISFHCTDVAAVAHEATSESKAILKRSYAYCNETARREAGNFYWSFRLLPREARQSMCALYAFMRHTDDLADREAPVHNRQADLNAWRKRLDSALDHQPPTSAPANSALDWPGFPALVKTVENRRIPRRYLHAVIDGMVMDLGPVRIRDAAEFERYCWHVASVVGLCCLHIWGFEADAGKAEKLAERLGLAFQRTNILRDVAEDFERDRIYLPATDLVRYGVSEHELSDCRSSDALKSLVAEHTRLARAEYRAVDDLLPLISPACRPMLRAIARIYEGVLNTIERQDCDVLIRRASVPKWRKVAIMIGAVFA
jgi:phytoene synthase